MNYEYGVAHHLIDIDGEVVHSSHRFGMTEAEADQWIREWEEDSGKKSVFVKIRRQIGEWEIVK